MAAKINNLDYNKMPNNLESEQSVLGCILIDNNIAMDIISQLEPIDFYSESNRIIYEAIRAMIFDRIPVDSVTLTAKLENEGNFSKVGGINYIVSLLEIVPSSLRYKHYLQNVKTTSTMRKLIRASQDIIDNSYQSQDREDAMAFAEKKIFDISNQIESSSLTNLELTYSEALQMFEDLAKGDSKYKATKTGFKDLDDILNGGLHKSDLVVIAARPGVGKTSLALNIIQQMGIDQKKVCAVFSLEMSKIQLAQRIICSRANVSIESALKGQLTKNQWERLLLEEKKLKNSRVYVDDSALVNPAEILSKCRNLQLKEKELDVVMIDYIQLMKGSDKSGREYDNRQQEVSDISRNMKIIAKELNVPVLALSQLSRAVTSRRDQRPQLSDLRESGAIEQDADIVMFIHRPDKVEGNVNAEPNVAELLIEKHRSGRQGTVKLKWDGATTSFKNYDSVVVTENRKQDEGSQQLVKVDDEEISEIF